MAEPNLHLIPLTVDEHAFLAAVLRANVEAGNADLAPVAAVISATPPSRDGLVEIAIEDEDRERVRRVLSYSALRAVDVEFGELSEAWDRPSYMPRRKVQMSLGEVTTNTCQSRLELMFVGYSLDTERLRKILHRTPYALYEQVFSDDLGFRMRSDVPRWLFERGYYVDYVHASVNAYTRLDVVKAAAAYLAEAGCCELKPMKVRKDMHPRIGLDWLPDMYVAHPARRRRDVPIVRASVSREEDEALTALALDL